MTITTDDGIDKFGTLDDLDSSSGSLADDAFSVAGDMAAWTNDDDAREAILAFTWQYASGTLDAGASVALHARRLNWSGTADEEVPSADYSGAYVGSIPLDDGLATSTDSTSIVSIPLQNFKTSQEYEFYIQAKAGVTIAAGWTAEITPKTLGPHG